VAKRKEPEVLDNGIRIDLGGGYWILFTKAWGSMDSQKFRVSDDITALKSLIKKTLDWHIPDENFKDLPFEKDKLLAQLEAFEKDPRAECFSIPTPLQMELARAFYKACGVSYLTPFEDVLPVMPPDVS
jgi:hypothetical protein